MSPRETNPACEGCFSNHSSHVHYSWKQGFFLSKLILKRSWMPGRETNSSLVSLVMKTRFPLLVEVRTPIKLFQFLLKLITYSSYQQAGDCRMQQILPELNEVQIWSSKDAEPSILLELPMTIDSFTLFALFLNNMKIYLPHVGWVTCFSAVSNILK